MQIDIANAEFVGCERMGQHFGLPTVWLRRFNENKATWRAAAQSYYGASEAAVKRHFMMTSLV